MSKVKQVRRRWSREDKLAIISEIGVDGATVLDVSRRHDMDRHLLKRWVRQEDPESRKNATPATFLPLVVCEPDPNLADPCVSIEVGLSNGRHLKLSSHLSDTQILRFIALVDAV